MTRQSSGDLERATPARWREAVAGKKPLNPELTAREKQVVELVAEAKRNKEIAHELHLTEGTVKEYLHRIFRKLGVADRTQLAIRTLKNQMGSR
jgi:DNA-binding NarL/FixJ family response regulator